MEAFICAIRNRELDAIRRFFLNRNPSDIQRHFINRIHRTSSIHFGSHFHYETSPLHEAASRGDVSILAFLVQNGGNVNLELSNGKTPLHMASMYNRVYVVRY